MSALPEANQLQPGDVALDHVDHIVIPAAIAGRYHNELSVLHSWQHGLHFLYWQLRSMEKLKIRQFRADVTGITEEFPQRGEMIFNNISCCNQWYTVTLCNFVELIGCIGREVDQKNKPPREYLKSLIEPTRQYRNTVAAHVYRARPSDKHSTPASQFLSLIPSSAIYNGRFQVGAYATTIVRSGNTTTASTLPWQPTTLHEELAARFWPDWRPPDWLVSL